VARIEAAGGRVVADTCLVVAPVADLGFHTLATNSAKMAFYAPSHSGLAVALWNDRTVPGGSYHRHLAGSRRPSTAQKRETAVSAQAAAAPGRFPRPQAPGPSTEGSRELAGRAIKPGVAEGIALVSPEPLGFLGGVDPGNRDRDRARPCPAGKPAWPAACSSFPRARAAPWAPTRYFDGPGWHRPGGHPQCHQRAIVAVGAIMAASPWSTRSTSSDPHRRPRARGRRPGERGPMKPTLARPT
jgi:hypothetical protein